MDSNNWKAAQGQVRIPGRIRVYGDCDWRTQLHSDSRLRIVNKILETLKRHLPFDGQEGLQKLEKIAIRFEEKVYTAATSQDAYLRTISLKMLKMKSGNPVANSLQPDAASNSRNPQDPGWRAAQWQVQIPGQVMSGDAVANPDMEGGDWRTQLHSDSRQRIVNKIMETLKRHLPFYGQEGLQELEKIAIRFEEKMNTVATSQDDYLRKISLKLLTMEEKSSNPGAASNSRNPQDPESGRT